MSMTRKALVCATLVAVAIGLGGGVASAGGWHEDDPSGHGCILKNGGKGTYTYDKAHNHWHCLPKR